MHIEDEQDVDLATEAATRAGLEPGQARITALRLVAERLHERAASKVRASEYAERNAYYRERQQAGDMILRARGLVQQAIELQENNP